jgi:hypothetical protein
MPVVEVLSLARSPNEKSHETSNACQQTSAYVSIRQQTSAYVSIRQRRARRLAVPAAYVSICQQDASIRQHTSAIVSIRQQTIYRSMRTHTQWHEDTYIVACGHIYIVA